MMVHFASSWSACSTTETSRFHAVISYSVLFLPNLAGHEARSWPCERNVLQKCSSERDVLWRPVHGQSLLSTSLSHDSKMTFRTAIAHAYCYWALQRWKVIKVRHCQFHQAHAAFSDPSCVVHQSCGAAACWFVTCLPIHRSTRILPWRMVYSKRCGCCCLRVSLSTSNHWTCPDHATSLINAFTFFAT